ncbi:tRNA pseudouridine(65) synthase TruC [Pseudoteredinibacter isoporae]|nr:tRNA pseudouridine(65) synthase TruC [Pseudoteredinibacter isoporae]NHO88718.1 tRNA pseudouridine(65) synthase TruC [Pseudoteredinibacter isoporae]NIB22591.1 tRNA pseudouridine(65) synthase TruC [Pseudoteredinibacter isoporae]
MTETLPILYQDEHLVAVNKPSGLLVHRSMIDRHETRFAMQIVRDQIGQHVFPLHRLDKPTSGVLVFALSSEIASLMNQQQETEGHKWQKGYLAVVRGWAPEDIFIDHPLKEKLDKITDKKAQQDKPAQSAETRIKRLATTELDVKIEGFDKSRYSLVWAKPKQGRKHQIRRHCKHISHPIIGDAKHGRGRHNRYFKEHLDCPRLLLHAASLSLKHPMTEQPIELWASLDDCWQLLLNRFDWQTQLPTELQTPKHEGTHDTP